MSSHPASGSLKTLGPSLERLAHTLWQTLGPLVGHSYGSTETFASPRTRAPYKTNVAMEFWHLRGGKKSYTGLYLHLAPGDSFAGAGIWNPDPPTLNRVRRAIVSRPEAWRRVKESGLKMEGESLKRPPAGFDRNHPFVEDLKLKDITAGVRFSNTQVTGPRFMKDFVQASKKLDPLNKFLAGTLSLPW